jgi:hypothetical protein
MPDRLSRGFHAFKIRAMQVRNFFRGHGSSGVGLLDHLRDSSAHAVFAACSRYLKSRPEEQVNQILLNTCSLSPALPTIAHWADWSLTRYGFTGNERQQPALVFVKADSDYLIRFYRDYLPLIGPQTRYVLVTGDSDRTIPNQVDLRFPRHDDEVLAMIKAIHDDPRLIHWYSLSVDEAWPKLSPLPLGFWEKGGTELYQNVLHSARSRSILDRQLKVFCAHRTRGGPQWLQRQLVTEKALGDWRDVVEYRESVSSSEFFDTISRYAFVMCVGGGGLDPSPKAWTALLAGCIPLIEANPTTEAYRDLPVIFVDDWLSLELDIGVLEKWRHDFAPYFDEPGQRKAVLEKLSMGHWLRYVRAGCQ